MGLTTRIQKSGADTRSAYAGLLACSSSTGKGDERAITNCSRTGRMR